MRTSGKTDSRTLLQIKLRPLLNLLGYCCLLIGVAVQPAQAASFFPVDLTEASLQSRRFEQVRLNHLVSACLSVIQDIGFHVVETESAPVVIVASAQGRGFHTLTINVQPVDEDTGDYQVRLVLDSPILYPGWLAESRASSAQADFYQDFFKHLNKTYFTERAMQ